MKLFFLLAALVVIFIGLSNSKASMDYSPLDNYVKAVNKNYQDSVRYANETKLFLDSLNNR